MLQKERSSESRYVKCVYNSVYVIYETMHACVWCVMNECVCVCVTSSTSLSSSIPTHPP